MTVLCMYMYIHIICRWMNHVTGTRALLSLCNVLSVYHTTVLPVYVQ